jgi:hypothetical protein
MRHSQNDRGSEPALNDKGANVAPSAAPTTHQPKGMARLVLKLIQPYRGWLAIVFLAMLVETAMTLATPWPLKIVIDNVIGTRPLPEWLSWIRDLPLGNSQAGLATLAAILYILSAALAAVASYIDNYYTESVGQYVANDLRMRVYNHLERGVSIHVMAKPPHTLKKDKLTEGVGGMRILDDVGIKVHKLKHLKLHGKMLLADGARAIVGSINLAPGSFDDRRELAIEIQDEDVVGRLQHVAHHDWKHSHPLDLSDEGLLADLAKRGGGGEQLVLGDAEK